MHPYNVVTPNQLKFVDLYPRMEQDESIDMWAYEFFHDLKVVLVRISRCNEDHFCLATQKKLKQAIDYKLSTTSVALFNKKPLI